MSKASETSGASAASERTGAVCGNRNPMVRSMAKSFFIPVAFTVFIFSFSLLYTVIQFLVQDSQAVHRPFILVHVFTLIT